MNKAEKERLKPILREKLLAVRGDPDHVHIKDPGAPFVYGVVTYHTPAHPEHDNHHCGVRVDSPDALDSRITDMFAGIERTGLKADGSNADTWTGKKD